MFCITIFIDQTSILPRETSGTRPTKELEKLFRIRNFSRATVTHWYAIWALSDRLCPLRRFLAYVRSTFGVALERRNRQQITGWSSSAQCLPPSMHYSRLRQAYALPYVVKFWRKNGYEFIFLQTYFIIEDKFILQNTILVYVELELLFDLIRIMCLNLVIK